MPAWWQSDLAKRAEVRQPTPEAFEAKPESRRMKAANTRLLVCAFKKAGFELILENGGGAGIRFQGQGWLKACYKAVL